MSNPAAGGDHFDLGVALLEGKWTLSICAVLLDGPTTFTGLRKAIAGLSANILTQRLERLTRDGIVERAGPRDYQLTAWGGELVALVDQTRQWGALAPPQPT